MRRIMYLLMLLGLGLGSCKKEVKEAQFGPYSVGEKLAAIIPPISNPSKQIKLIKDSCITINGVNPDTLYLSGQAVIDNSKFQTYDTIVKVDLGYNHYARGIFKYNFIKGNSYTISIPVIYHGKDVSSIFSSTSESYMPSFSAFTLKNINSSNVSSLCTTDLKSLKVSNDVTVSSNFAVGGHFPAHRTITHQLTFTANECFEFIGFDLINNSSNHPKTIFLQPIKILSTPLLQFNGETSMCMNEIQTITYGASGFIINDPVYWFTTGDLEIVGSNYGSSIQVKSTGPNGGTVSINTCDNNYNESSNMRFNISSKNILNTTISGNPIWQYGETYDLDYNAISIDGFTDFEWTVSGHSKVTVTKINNTTARLSTTGAIPFRTNVDLTLKARGVGPCGLSINQVSKTIRLVYDRL